MNLLKVSKINIDNDSQPANQPTNKLPQSIQINMNSF